MYSSCLFIFLGCEADEVLHGDSCYRFVTDTPRTLNESVRDCIKRNSHLVYIESMNEQTFLVNHASSLRDSHYWIGLVAVNVTYIWSDGSQQDPELFSINTDDGGNCVYAYRYFLWNSVLLHEELQRGVLFYL